MSLRPDDDERRRGDLLESREYAQRVRFGGALQARERLAVAVQAVGDGVGREFGQQDLVGHRRRIVNDRGEAFVARLPGRVEERSRRILVSRVECPDDVLWRIEGRAAADDDELLDALGPMEVKERRQDTAVGAASGRVAVVPHQLHEAVEMFDDVRLRRLVSEVDVVGEAVAEYVGGVNGELAREHVDVAHEHIARGADRMGEEERPAAPLVQVAGAHHVDVNKTDLHGPGSRTPPQSEAALQCLAAGARRGAVGRIF